MYPSFNARALGLDLDPAATLELAARHGFVGVDLLVRDLVDGGHDPAEVRRRMDDLGLRAGAFPMPFDWRRDEESYRAGLDALPRWCRAAEALGLARTGTWVLPETPLRPEGAVERAAHRDEVLDWHVRRLGPIARILADHGIRLGLEILGPHTLRTGRGWPIFESLGGEDLAELLGRLEAAGIGGVGWLVDAFHLYAAGEAVEVAWGRGIGRVVWVHVADVAPNADPDRRTLRDGDRGLPGECGLVDVGSLLRGLAARGYDGPVTVEPLAGCSSLAGLDPDAIARAVSDALRPFWPEVQLSTGSEASLRFDWREGAISSR